MKVVIQRVRVAQLFANNIEKQKIGHGLVVLVGVDRKDTREDLEYIVKKTVHTRIFKDQYSKMNLSLLDMGGELLLVSQFTLLALTKKGNRPSFIHAASPENAEKMYKELIFMFEKKLNMPIATGIFGANMQIKLVNDGPVTLIIDSQCR